MLIAQNKHYQKWQLLGIGTILVTANQVPGNTPTGPEE
ncbi:MAG: hypothetical protein AVDCRST_MAG96-3701 [uncultured Segetibacter sp.]|uniref:Uncharacterized protein n=1 Tax=uncultured Segetibacter sp. TaxID=481133 RepID=A0A6J4TXR7_9BACT|nr:MAG: hypothetical protein AVDCRST_MAG96-3701 [uncultured Segetibacter sp.]